MTVAVIVLVTTVLVDVVIVVTGVVVSHTTAPVEVMVLVGPATAVCHRVSLTTPLLRDEHCDVYINNA